MISLKIAGIIHGFRLKAILMSFTTITIGVVFSYQETGIISPKLWAHYLILMMIYTYATILNSYYDWLLGVDDEKTTTNRMMFDYGITKTDVQNYMIFGIVVECLLFHYCFSHLAWLDYCVALFIIVQISLISVFYNAPPLRMKNILFGAEIAVFGSYGLLTFAAYFFNTGIMTFNSFVYGIPCFILGTLTITGNLLHDIEDDRKGGSYSSAMHFGPIGSYYIFISWIYIAYISLIIISIIKSNMLINLPFLIVPYFSFISKRVKNQNYQNIKLLGLSAVSLFNILYLVGGCL
ncbi:hypothetical protein CYY_008369 [Polysphondylium violaceum]|uniref:UbiA prenyltransferase family protein n=1 Tax=Polysphondylium violaceum TaxID=133409 RepID=A0A8J4PVC3_9MYCE|nr:hypothetical protein CYY_008369 [Polysphondylium violaceum]